MKNSTTQLNKDLEGFTKGEWKWKQSRGNNEFEHRIYCGMTVIAELDGENSQEVKANAEHIVKCVNSHNDLVAALQACKEWFGDGYIDLNTPKRHLYEQIEKALTKVK